MIALQWSRANLNDELVEIGVSIRADAKRKGASSN
jgi:lambda repressor-like predicted transcriptional regulator